MQEKTLYLKEGGFLKVFNGYVRYVDRDGKERHLTPAQQSILTMLIEAQGVPVPYSRLYEGYTGQRADGNVNQYLTKIRNRISSPELRSAICAVSGFGYRLDMSMFESHPQQPQVSPAAADDAWFPKLAGDYYGFYLYSLGDGTVIGGYLHIEKVEDGLLASAVLGIQSDEVLRSEELASVFANNHWSQYHQKYSEVKQGFTENDQRCFFAQGKVFASGTTAIITMETSHKSLWTILVDAGRMMKDYHRPYRGGMGLLVSLTRSHEKFCARAGLIRKEFMQPTITLDNPRIREILKIYGDPDGGSMIHNHDRYQPLKMDVLRDRKWYDWFMRGAK